MFDNIRYCIILLIAGFISTTHCQLISFISLAIASCNITRHPLYLSDYTDGYYTRKYARLTSVPSDIPSDATQVDISSNELSELESNVFRGIPLCLDLHLGYNLIAQIDDDAFAGLSLLEVLNLNYNRLTTIRTNTFSSLTSLQELTIRYNQISMLEARAFGGLEHLRILNLANNHIAAIAPGVFTGLPSIRALFLIQ